MTVQTLTAPGARLHYEVRGSGPALLFIPGGNGDGDVYAGVAELLADRFTVITYDRRGFSRSVLDGPVPADRLGTDCADVHRLLTEVAREPAHVFGSSSGAIVALRYAATHPDWIRTLIPHEPPAITLLPDAERLAAFTEDVYATYRASGMEAAMRVFADGVGMRAPEPAQDERQSPEPAEMMRRIQVNMEFWMEHELRQYPRTSIDVAALRELSGRVVPAGGRESHEQWPYRPNTVLAERLHLEMVDFPGGHVGYGTHPSEFANALTGILRHR